MPQVKRHTRTLAGMKPARLVPSQVGVNSIPAHQLEKYKLHPNMMTPEIMNTRTVGNTVIELSTGRGIEGNPIYGVSVSKYTGDTELPFPFISVGKSSRMFRDENQAQVYMAKLIGIYERARSKAVAQAFGSQHPDFAPRKGKADKFNKQQADFYAQNTWKQFKRS